MENTNNSEEEVRLTPEEYLARRKREMRRRSQWAIGLGATVVVAMIGLVLFLLNSPEYAADLGIEKKDFFGILFRNIFFLLGLFFIVAGAWGLYEAHRLTLEDLAITPEAAAFLREAEGIQPVYSYIILGCLIAVFIAQIYVGNDDSGDLKSTLTAGLTKPDTRINGEYWRMLTSGFLHAGALHIYFNGQALYGFGSSIEVISNRAHLAIVFLLSVICGSFFSLMFMTEGTSIGASGGIMGLIGYLAIYAYRHKRRLPPGFMRSMLVNIGFIAAFGLVAYQIVDNFAHFGGLLAGAVYGFLQIPRGSQANPRAVGFFAEASGMIAMGIIVFTAVLTILIITEYIKF